MNVMVKLISAFLLCLFIGLPAQAQDREKKKVVVYVTGDADAKQNKVIGSKVGNAFVESGKYILIETSKEFLDALMKEVDRQTSGDVRSNQIVALGNRYGVKTVVVVEISDFGYELYIVSRMIDLETGVVGRGTDTNGPGATITQLSKLSQDIAGKLLRDPDTGMRQQSTSYSANSGSGSNVETFTVKGVTFEMVKVDGGGITPYYIGKTEVTQSLWKAVMGNNPSYFKGDNNPVEYVTWYDCQEFVERLSRMTGRNFRLPTEKEWEYAAKGGSRSRGYAYSGSDDINRVAWYYDNSNRMTHPVGQKLDNELGIFDMTGNVYEWCSDCYNSDCSYRVDRGGNYSREASYCHVSYRDYYAPSYRGSNLGLRLAL